MKQYLGDGVYAEVDPTTHGSIVLTTENGVSTTNIIYLDSGVILAFLNYLKEIES